MSATLWIGFGFLVALVIFLVCSFFFTPKLTDDQRAILKFLLALCAGFSGGFLTGGALFEMHKTGPTTIGISGTAGFALFFVVWFFYPKVFKLADGFQCSIPVGWTFQDAVDSITQAEAGVANYVGFTPQELGAHMKAKDVSSKSVSEAIGQLRLMTAKTNAVRPYEVTKKGSVYNLTIQ